MSGVLPPSTTIGAPARASMVTTKRLAWLRFGASLVRRVVAEPLTHFVLAGFALFVAGSVYQRETNLYRIVVTPQHVRQIADAYTLQFGTRPDPRTLEGLVERDIDDEILYREGVAMKLDRDDEIIRRRILQKAGFVLQDLELPAEPTEAELAAYYQAHASRYMTPPQATFTHIYFAPDRGGDAASKARALETLRRLAPGLARAPEKGDNFPDLYDFSAYEPAQVQRLFGRTPFSQVVFTAPVGRWTGPFRSGYGWHLARVSARAAPARPPLSAVRGKVRDDYLQEASSQANKQAFAKLASRFSIVREDRKAQP